jgi:hypothetical protein
MLASRSPDSLGQVGDGWRFSRWDYREKFPVLLVRYRVADRKLFGEGEGLPTLHIAIIPSQEELRMTANG